MASSSSSNAIALKKYDVFISFRGDDTRAGFTSHLHTALCKTYFETYIDYMIEKGNQVWAELEKAIKDSTLFIVVFSENYASSTWCLNELVEIMECQKNGQDFVVIPVFYQIEPSHVRKQTGSYGTALEKHEKQGKIDDKMMQNWKNALTQAANLSGFDSTTYRSESDLIKDITRDVLRKLNHKCTHEITCNFIRDENYWSIQSLIKSDSSKVQIIGLWGMGGIGKTTLAATMFQRFSSNYEGSCFLEHVTNESISDEIKYTRNKLFSKLLKEDLDIDTSKLIPPVILRRLKRMKSFIVLDDVHTLELVQNLVGVGCGWLGVGSTVIVTTRDKHVLISGGIEKIHQVKKMNSQNSLQLFSLNAFESVLPKEGYVELSQRAIDYAEGNPLALKILGSSLRRCKSEIEWNSALAKLKEIPNTEIDKILRWSYNELDDKEKNIFLDIACFFKGHERETITKTLNECGFYADIGIRLLLDKALIRLDFRNRIQMHDLIQKMGKQIVREESLKFPEQRSRLFDPKEVCHVLKDNSGTNIVEAILLDSNQCTNINLSPKVFEKMENLRLLAFRDHKGIKSVSLPRGLDYLPENLRYFSWDGYPLKSLPSTFSPEMLVQLSLKESRVEKLWDGEMYLPNLEILDLTGSKKLIECPNVSGSPYLKDVILSKCESLPEVDSSIFHLQKLEGLIMSGCKSLKTLSSNTCSPALRQLNVVDCVNLQDFSVTFASADRLTLGFSNSWNELPSSLLNTKNLESFQFPMIKCLVDLPENFCDSIWLLSPPNREHDPSITLHKILHGPAFVCVKHLTLYSITILTEIPDSISLLSSLESLTLFSIGIRSLPETIKYLPRLYELCVHDCQMLQSIPMFSKFIPFFVVWNCESLETVLSSMGKSYLKPNPRTVSLLNCKKLEPHSYHTVLKDAIAGIELEARLNSGNEEDNTIQYLLPAAMPGREYWSHYSSTQVSFTLEVPPNLLGFSYYLVLSQGHVGYLVDFGCDCHLDNISGQRIYIRSFPRVNIFTFGLFFNDDENSIRIKSDHVILWYDPISCKQIMEEIKAINHVNSTGYNPKLTFTFFVNETLHDQVTIKECGFRWIYHEETVSSTIFKSHDEDEETVPPTRKLQQRVFGTPVPSLELVETKGLRYLLE